MSSMSQVTGTFIDSRDGKVYTTVILDSVTWMAQNLAYKSDSGYIAYNNDTINIANYGYLYNWKTAMNTCPTGWHLPSGDEFSKIEYYSGGYGIAGGRLKEKDTLHWKAPNLGATNERGFTALPGGYYTLNDKLFLAIQKIEFIFNGIGIAGAWWSSSPLSPNPSGLNAWYWFMKSDSSEMYDAYDYKINYYSVRCVKD